MKSSSSPTSVTATPDTQPLASSSSPPPPPPQGLQSPELQAEFLRECRNKFGSRSDAHDSTVVSPAAPPPSSSPLRSPFSPSPSSSPRVSSPSSPCNNNRQARLSLSSPELLSELKDSKTRPLRHVPAQHGLTTVFSGRGRRGGQSSGPAYPTQPTNQKTSP